MKNVLELYDEIVASEDLKRSSPASGLKAHG